MEEILMELIKTAQKEEKERKCDKKKYQRDKVREIEILNEEIVEKGNRERKERIKVTENQERKRDGWIEGEREIKRKCESQ